MILFILAVISFTKVSSMITTFLVLIGIYFMGKEAKNKTEYFMLAWIFSNIIFYSYYTIKVNRYMLPIFPAVIYFAVVSIDTINRHIKINRNIIPFVLIVLFIIQAFAFTLTFEPTDEFMTVEDVSSYIIDNNPDYENLSIGVYNVRAYNWWLGGNLLAIESGDEQTIDSCNATYYISNKVLENVTNYTQIKISIMFISTKKVFKMNILHIVPSFAPCFSHGGVVNASYQIAKKQVENGHNVTVYTTDSCDKRLKFENNYNVDVDGIKVFYFKNMSNSFKNKATIDTPISSIRHLRKTIADFDIIHIHEHRHSLAIAAHRYAQKNNVPYVLQSHGSVLPFFQKRS